jgi:hypothetical protein
VVLIPHTKHKLTCSTGISELLEAFLPSQNSGGWLSCEGFIRVSLLDPRDAKKMKHSLAKAPFSHDKRLSTRRRNKQGIFAMIKVKYFFATCLKCRRVIALSSAKEKSFWRTLFSYMCVLKCLSFFKHVNDVRLSYVVLWVEI